MSVFNLEFSYIIFNHTQAGNLDLKRAFVFSFFIMINVIESKKINKALNASYLVHCNPHRYFHLVAFVLWTLLHNLYGRNTPSIWHNYKIV